MRCCLTGVVRFLIGVLVLLIVVAAAAYFMAIPQVDRLLADAVRREYMLPPSSTVELQHGTLLDTYQGKVHSFLVEAEEAKLEGLMIEDVELFATGIQFDLPRTLVTGDAELKGVDHARLRFRVSEEALEDRWGASLERKGVKNVDVDLSGEEITVTGDIDLKLTEVHCKATGNFEIEDRSIRMNVTSINFGGASIGLSEFKKFFTKSIRTPLLDLGEFKMGVKVSELKPRDGYLYVEAESEGLEELAALMKKQTQRRAKELAEGEDGGQSDAQELEDKLKDAGKKLEDLGGQLKDKIF